eukprot:CAMPEP_0184504488 /NCGR_PEP_ID=MMETSP0113_2-20130426/52493_1 /TAXON_ID=91329 /ORGANISM="Norrisiella sphaerica, Strain BC52" /LENGTH=99 /DNA_ID=CAMNT_0026894137 /DNA_START=74 /DNA_END=374 /DNA_ORIENTATION=+
MSTARKKKRSAGPRFKGKLPDDMQGCLEILKTLQQRADAGPFLEPVDWKRFDLPDYPSSSKGADLSELYPNSKPNPGARDKWSMSSTKSERHPRASPPV